MDAMEPENVLGWEVLDSGETDKQTGSSLEADKSSGLVKALVGVLHKG